MITVCAEAVLLPPDFRRALVLTGSELVINALKYGYPTEVGGTISVSLVARYGEVELIVEDDGIGLVETDSAGDGGGPLEQLRVVLGATLTRTTSRKGHGFGFRLWCRSTCHKVICRVGAADWHATRHHKKPGTPSFTEITIVFTRIIVIFTEMNNCQARPVVQLENRRNAS